MSLIVWINQRKVYNMSFPNLKYFSLWPIFLSPMLLASPTVPQTQETRKVCVSTLLPNQYAQIIGPIRTNNQYAQPIRTNNQYAQPIRTNNQYAQIISSISAQIIQSCLSTVVPGADYSNIGF